VRIAVIDVGGGQIADYGAGGVLGHRVVIQCDVTGDFVHVANGDGEGLCAAQAASICRRHVQRDGITGFVVEAYPILEFQLTIDHFEAGIGHGVGVAVAIVDVGRGQIAHNGTGSVLGHRAVIQGNVAGDFVHISDGDGEGLGA